MFWEIKVSGDGGGVFPYPGLMATGIFSALKVEQNGALTMHSGAGFDTHGYILVRIGNRYAEVWFGRDLPGRAYRIQHPINLRRGGFHTCQPPP